MHTNQFRTTTTDPFTNTLASECISCIAGFVVLHFHVITSRGRRAGGVGGSWTRSTLIALHNMRVEETPTSLQRTEVLSFCETLIRRCQEAEGRCGFSWRRLDKNCHKFAVIKGPFFFQQINKSID